MPDPLFRIFILLVFLATFSAWITPALGGPAGDETALRMAAREGRQAEVSGLLAQGVAADAAGPYGETALYYASQKGHSRVVLALLKAGATPDRATSEEITPLMASDGRRRKLQPASGV